MKFIFVLLMFNAFNSMAQTKTIPAIELSDIKGDKVDVSQLSKDGKIIIIDFWATWCIPCKNELANLSELYEEWQKKYNVEIVAISVDDSRNTAKVKATADGFGWTFKVLQDSNQDLKRALNFQNVPYSLLLDKQGNIVYIHAGYVDGDEFELEEQIKKIAGL